MSTTQPIPIKLEFSGTIKRLDYEYIVEGLGGNWPVVITPHSGAFVASSKSGSIDAQAMFCPNTGVCLKSSPDVMDYNINYTNIANNSANLFSIIRAKIFEKGSNGTDAIYSKSFLLQCNGCVKKPIVTIPNYLSFSISDNTTPEDPQPDPQPDPSGGNSQVGVSGMHYTDTLATSDTDMDKIKEFTINIRNLDMNNNKYTYIIQNDFNNWPISVFPISGQIISNTSSIDIPVKVKFCKDGLAFDDIVDYSTIDGGGVDQFSTLTETENLPSDISICNPEKDMLAILKVVLIPENRFDSTIYSNQTIIRCDNCIKEPAITLSVSTDAPIIASNSNLYPITNLDAYHDKPVNFSILAKDLPLNNMYRYTIKPINSDWPFIVLPSSDIFYVTEKEQFVRFEGMFCVSTGVCQPERNGVIPYVLADSSYKKLTWYKPSVFFNIAISHIDGEKEYYSNPVMLECNDCTTKHYVPVIVKDTSDSVDC